MLKSSVPTPTRGRPSGFKTAIPAMKAIRPKTSGLIKSSVPGRTDKIPMSAKPESYVVPADVVSGMGQGNTLAGADRIDKMLKTGPYGSSLPKNTTKSKGIGLPRGRKLFAEGGIVPRTDIITAGGEYLIDADDVIAIGGGDYARGHEILDGIVLGERAKTIKELSNLPGPKK